MIAATAAMITGTVVTIMAAAVMIGDTAVMIAGIAGMIADTVVTMVAAADIAVANSESRLAMAFGKLTGSQGPVGFFAAAEGRFMDATGAEHWR